MHDCLCRTSHENNILFYSYALHSWKFRLFFWHSAWPITTIFGLSVFFRLSIRTRPNTENNVVWRFENRDTSLFVVPRIFDCLSSIVFSSSRSPHTRWRSTFSFNWRRQTVSRFSRKKQTRKNQFCPDRFPHRLLLLFLRFDVKSPCFYKGTNYWCIRGRTLHTQFLFTNFYVHPRPAILKRFLFADPLSS